MTSTSSATTRQGEEDQSATQATILPARSFADIFTALRWKGSLYVFQTSNQWPPILICNSLQLHCPCLSHRLNPLLDKKSKFHSNCHTLSPVARSCLQPPLSLVFDTCPAQRRWKRSLSLEHDGQRHNPHHHQQIIVLSLKTEGCFNLYQDFAEGFWRNSMFHSTTSYL